MSALEDVLAALRTAAERTGAARVNVSEALDRWDEHGEILAGCLHGTNDPDAQEVLEGHTVAAEQLRLVWEQVSAVVAAVEQYAEQIGGGTSAPAALAVSGGGGGGGGGSVPVVVAKDGSRYPDAAAGVVDALPRRVRSGTGADKTVGFLDGAVGQPLTSGFDQTWSVEVRRNAVERGIPPQAARFLSAHVELKAAEQMIREGRQSSELVINNVPCDLQPGKGIGCEQAIERYLPAGSSLTVHGTTEDGNPFTRTYKGKR